MSSKIIKGKYVELTYNIDTFRVISTKIELGDCLFVKFDELASYLTYKHIQMLSKNLEKKEAPSLGLDLAPAHVRIEKSRVKELHDDFDKIIKEVQATVVWADDLSMH